MDIFPTELVHTFSILIKIVFLVIGTLLVAVNYFQTHEALKVEKRLNIALPGSVHFVMGFQLLLSIIFVAVIVVILFLC